MVNRSNAESALTIGDAETVLGRRIAAKLPNDFSACAEATTKGVPVLEHAPGSSLADSFRQLAVTLPDPTAPTAAVSANGAGGSATRKRRLFRLGRV